MADKRGKDYNKRLNYDELKDKITKKKQPINAPYRTATIIRNSNQMQNLLSMSTLDMEEHQVKQQNEQIKQTVKNEMINREQSKSNVSVVSNSEDVKRSQDDLAEMYEDSFELLEQRQKEQEQAAIEQNKEVLGKTGNLGSKLATAALTGGKQLLQIGAATAAAAAGANPAVAAVAHQATGAVLQAGYEGVTGGSSSSSSGTQPQTPKTKVPPGENWAQTPERDLDEEIKITKKQVREAKIDEIIIIMNHAYEKKLLNETQTSDWEALRDTWIDLDPKDQSGREIIRDKIIQEYAVYLTYQKSIFNQSKIMSRSTSVKPRNLVGAARKRDKSASAKARNQSTASSSGMQPIPELPFGDSGGTGGEGTKRRPGRPVGSKNKAK